jgi:hypothetical protein
MATGLIANHKTKRSGRKCIKAGIYCIIISQIADSTFFVSQKEYLQTKG